jgi:hypothetical protein
VGQGKRKVHYTVISRCFVLCEIDQVPLSMTFPTLSEHNLGMQQSDEYAQLAFGAENDNRSCKVKFAFSHQVAQLQGAKFPKS